MKERREILIVGLNHRTAPVEIRERLSFTTGDKRNPLKELISLDPIDECVIISTCNRVEVVVVSHKPEQAENYTVEFFSSYNKVPVEEFKDHLYMLKKEEAVRHLFRVTSSLDSMVLGEPQIIGQVKDSYRAAVENKTTGAILNHLFHRAFGIAKKVRTETAIANHAVSVSFAAVELARKIFGSLCRKRCMLVGAGEMSELAAKHLVSAGIGEIIIANRTFETAARLAEELKGRPVHLSEMYHHLRDVDIIITSTGAPGYIVGRSEVKKALKERKNRPMFFIDIAVPRDVDPDVNELENVYLYDIDDLENVVNANLSDRQKEAEKAQALIDREVEKFFGWMASLEAVPTIIQLKEKLERIRKTELEKTMISLSHLGEREKKLIDILTTSIVNKIAHDPIIYLKRDRCQGGEDIHAIDIARKMFRLNDAEPHRSGKGNPKNDDGKSS